MQFINTPFLKRLLALALSIGILICLLKVSGFSSISSACFIELFFLGVIVLHKRSVPTTWLQRHRQSPFNAFMKSFVVYFVPALLLWALLEVQLLSRYLHQRHIVMSPFLVVLVFSAGALVLARWLLKAELARTRGYPQERI